MEHYPQFIGIAAATRPYGDMTLIGCHCLQASKLERLSHVDIISIQITLGHNDGRRDTFSRWHKWQSVGTRHSKFTAIPMVIKLRSIKQKNKKRLPNVSFCCVAAELILSAMCPQRGCDGICFVMSILNVKLLSIIWWLLSFLCIRKKLISRSLCLWLHLWHLMCHIYDYQMGWNLVLQTMMDLLIQLLHKWVSGYWHSWSPTVEPYKPHNWIA